MSGHEPSAPPESAEREQLAGRYILLERLGVGGMATVHRAYDARLEVFRAVKILAAKLASKRGVRQRLENEAKVMARLTHPNIVTLFEMGQDGDRLYLVMELVAGGSVMERVATAGALPPRVASRVGLEILAALEATHAHGIVHRDIKPHNVLLDTQGVAKVTDFGIARQDDLSGLTRTGAVMGTLAYMPPEQKLSARRVDARSDLYAVGCTLYCMLTAREPFDLYAALMDEALAADFYDGVPAPLVRVIGRATAFRMEDRFATAAEMAAALREALEALPEDPPAPPLVSPERREEARALASQGPTLLAVGTGATSTSTSGGEGGTASPTIAVDDSPIPPPARADEAPTSRPVAPPALDEARGGAGRWVVLALASLLVLVLLGAAGLLGVGAAVWSLTPAPTAPVVAAPAPAPPTSPVPVEIPPPPLPVVAREEPTAPDLVPSPRPSPVEPSPVPVVPAPPAPAPAAPAPAPVPAPDPVVPAPAEVVVIEPVPAPQQVVVVTPIPAPVPLAAPPPAPAPARTGGWQVEVTSSGRAKADILATLQADGTVADRTGRVGRPELIIKCSNGKPSFILRAGVPAVEPIVYETGIEVPFSEVLFDGTEKSKVANDPAVKNELRFSGERGWVEKVLASPTFTFGYSPSSTPMVTARFTNGDTTELRGALRAHCGF